MTAITPEQAEKLGIRPTPQKKSSRKETLDQQDFLKLMITQLTNQDPTKPVDNGQFAAQMAQFSSLTGIQELTTSFGKLSQTLMQGQTVQGASLVGKNVLVPGSSIEMDEGAGMSGAVDLSASVTNARLGIYDASGQVLRQIDLGSLGSGMQEFSWDGLDGEGKPVPAGKYELKLTATLDGKTEALPTLVNARVGSVMMGADSKGMQLRIEGLGSVPFSKVRRIG